MPSRCSTTAFRSGSSLACTKCSNSVTLRFTSSTGSGGESKSESKTAEGEAAAPAETEVKPSANGRRRSIQAKTREENKRWAKSFAPKLLARVQHPPWRKGKADDVCDAVLQAWWWLGSTRTARRVVAKC